MKEYYVYGILLLIIFVLILRLRSVNSLCKYNRDQYSKWEREYWLIRQNTDIGSRYDIHLSFSKYGEGNCIKAKINHTSQEG